jgi:type III pantothenate kinase
VTKDGKYLGGAIYPGFAISAKGLSGYTQLLPEVHIEKPESAVAKTTMTHIQSGIYWGLLGAIERLVFEMKSINPSPSSVQVVATGGCTQQDRTPTNFLDDLGELVDCIDPQLTLVGLHEILKEHIKKEK